MGMPPIPNSVPLERMDFLELRAKPGADPNISAEEEWYYSDTGEKVPYDPVLDADLFDDEDIDNAGEA